MHQYTTIDGVNSGPLAALLGAWEGDKGVDRAPEPDGEGRNPYTLTVQGDVMRYSETTILDIYDKTADDHKDVNTLRRTA